MNTMTFVRGSAGLLALCGMGRTLIRTVRRPRPQITSSLGESPSAVRVLRTDDELQEAIERALRYDRISEDALHRRIDRYTRSAKPHAATVIDFPTRRFSDTERADRRTVTT